MKIYVLIFFNIPITLEETTSDMTCPVIQDESKLETSMSSSRTTLVSAIDPSSSPPSTGIKLDSTLTEEDQETMIEDAMKVRMMVSRIFSRNLLIFTFSIRWNGQKHPRHLNHTKC